MIEFQGWPKTPRLFRDMIISEKIDGTNAAVVIEEATENVIPSMAIAQIVGPVVYNVAAQSRKRLITPEQDNFGFARWVWDNAAALVELLGEGRHFGEWWGQGIQRGYGLDHKRFSLFNVKRYGPLLETAAASDQALPGLRLVPTLYEGPFDTAQVYVQLDSLNVLGSRAAPGFDKPEGVIVYHHALNGVFKATLENDAEPKGRCS
jgi:hypothetical protein